MAKDENRIATLIEMGLDVAVDCSAAQATDTGASAHDRAEAAEEAELGAKIHALVAEVGALAILEAMRDAADMAADAHESDKFAVERLRAFSKHMGRAMATVSP